MTDCIFCRIVRGEAPASLVYTDELAVAFMDIQPVNPGHVLVVPKSHAAYLAELEEAVGAHLFKVGMRVAAALRRSGVKCEGVNFFLADGEAAFQDVFHVHLHIIPRYPGDGFGLRFGPHYWHKPDRSELDLVAAQIRQALPT
ncbi:MAG TPA: HIT family protein [Anaerolineae bacterium]|nr:HIT family protein [Anaerolineae bacterium]